MTSSLGLARGSIRLVTHDASWERSFDVARAELVGAVGSWLRGVEHIGSTAVRGLAAKPILDVMAGVDALELPQRLVLGLESLGFEHRPLDTVQGRIFFARAPANRRTHNLSVCVFGSQFWQERLAFRDRLRADAVLARRYEDLKRELAVRFPDDRLRYTDAKSAFVQEVLRDVAKSSFGLMDAVT